MDKTILISLPVEDLQSLIIDSVNACLKHTTPDAGQYNDVDRWFDLPELCQYHPDKPAPATVYGWVHTRKIPNHKHGKKLRFLRSEIDEWLKSGHRVTREQAIDSAHEHLKK